RVGLSGGIGRHAVVSRLSGPSPATQQRGPGAGAGTVAPLQPGACVGRCGLSRLILPGVVTAPGTGRGAARPRCGPWLGRTVRVRHVPRWLSARQPRAGDRRAGPVPREYGHLAADAEWGCPGVTSGPPGDGVSLDGPTRHGLTGVGGGDGRGHRGTVGCRGARVSPGGVARAAPPPWHPTGRTLFAARAGSGAPSTGQIPGATGRSQPESVVAAPGEAGPSPQAAGPALRLVHRGF